MDVGKFKIATSVSATTAGMGLNDIAQLAAFLIAILSGVMAIRHYWISTKLTKLQIKQLQEADNEP